MSIHYLDNSATTPLCAEVLQAMPEICGHFGNPSSLHKLGVEAENMISDSKRKILNAMGFRNAKLNQLVFTSCGTEASNAAIIGVATAKSRNKGKKIIIGETEHDCVRESAAFLEKNGYKIVRIPCPRGVWDMEKYKAELDRDVILVSAMLVNNETGAVNDIYRIFAEAKAVSSSIVTHTDAVQAFLKLPAPLSGYGADIITVSGHKIGAPKGIGAMYLDERLIVSKSIVPIIHGGGQEGGMRSGTENTLGIALFGIAAETNQHFLSEHVHKYSDLYSYMTEKLSGNANVRINIPQTHEIAKNIMNVTVFGIRSETLLHYLSSRDVYVSSGSACASNTGHLSYVLQSFGLPDDEVGSSIRISFGPQNTREDVDAFIESLEDGIEKLVHVKRVI